MIEAIGAINNVDQMLQPLGAAQAQNGPQVQGFDGWLMKEFAQVDGLLKHADVQVQRLASGDNVPIHQVMVSLEEAKLAFQLMTQVRNKLLDGFQELLRMQV